MNIFAGYAPNTQRKDKFDLNLQMTRGELNKLNKRPFYALYTQRFGSKVGLPNLIAAKIFTMLLPEELKGLSYATTTKQRRIFGHSKERQATINALAAGSFLKKGNEEEGFLVGLPLFRFDLSTSSVDYALNSVFKLPHFTLSQSDTPEERQEKIDKNDVINGYSKRLADNLINVVEKTGDSGYINIRVESLLAQCKNAYEKTALSALKSCRITVNGSGNFKTITVYVTVTLTAEDAKSLTGISAYGAIRNIDIYPVFYSWVSNGYKDAPTTSVAVTRISSALSPESSSYAKTNEYGLIIMPKGDLLYVPKSCDNTREYEDGYIQACTDSESDMFTIGNMATNGKRLPKNMQVLVDWTNNKYAFSNTVGQLVVLDLSQARTVTESHVVNVFKRISIERNDIERFQNYLRETTTLSPNNYLTVMDEFQAGVQMLDLSDVTLYDIATEGVFSTIKQLLCDLGAFYEKPQNQTRFLQEYSVSTASEQFAILIAMNRYFADEVMDDTLEKAAEIRSAAENQGVDEGWNLPSIPLLNPIIKAMPHQYRVLNTLKDNPKFALLPVAAGGGKTPLAIMEILYQYKQNTNSPYLVLCPSMLVSQYAQEVSFFTNARLNVIPITTKVIKREGFERLQKIFEAAPRNTVVVASYNALAYQAHKIAYGVESVNRFPTVEFLRQFGFQFALCDESHQLKNEGTTRSKSVRALLSDIPTIRLASGTMAYNMVTDLVGQTSIMDPSIFGDTKEFQRKYGLFYGKGANAKFAGLQQGAEAKIGTLLRRNVVVAGASRKEWAALLPTPRTSYHFVDLTPEQREFYTQFLKDELEEIANSAVYQRALAKLEALKKQVESGEADPEDLDSFEERLGAELRPYLQKIERFIIDPSSVYAGFDNVSNRSAKVDRVLHILKEHDKMFAEAIAQPGAENTNKVIIFTENTNSAEAIYKAAQEDPALKGTGILYKASEKVEALNSFNKDPKIRWLVGVETSINTGLNLQSASRIIRAEYPWAPGAIEQGDARILRPNKKGKDTRKSVFFDWVVCDGTIDTLKISRLMGKSVQVARFENPSDSRYESIGRAMNSEGEYEDQVPILSVSLKNLAASARFLDQSGGYEGDFSGTPKPGQLYSYFDAMQTLENLRRQTFKEYRESHPEELNPDGTMKDIPFVVEENPKDAKLLKYVPFVEGTNLYKADELGLQRLDDYLMERVKEDELYTKTLEDEGVEDDSEATMEEIVGGDDALSKAILELKDETCWTEYGECSIMSVSRNTSRVVVRPINTNERISLSKDTVFVVTRKETNPHELQNMILQSVGFKEYSDPEYVPPATLKDIKKRGRQVDPAILKKREDERKAKELADLTIPLQFAVINGIPCLRYKVEKGHNLACNLLQENGFTLAQRSWSAKIRNKEMLDKLLMCVNDLGFRVKKGYHDYSSAWVEIGRMLKRFASKNSEDVSFVGKDSVVTRIVNEHSITNMLREEQKPTNDEKLLRMFPMFMSGVVYAVMPIHHVYKAGNRIRRATARDVPGLIWTKTPKASSFETYFEDGRDAKTLVNKLKNDGLNISNYEDLIKQLDNIQVKRFKDAAELKRSPTADMKKKRSLTRTSRPSTKRPATGTGGISLRRRKTL